MPVLVTIATRAREYVQEGSHQETSPPKPAEKIPSLESNQDDTTKRSDGKSVKSQAPDDLPEARLTTLAARPPDSRAAADEAHEEQCPDPESKENDSSEPLLQDLFAGLEQRAARGVPVKTTPSPGLQLPLDTA
jgi:hypothetical protein